MTSYWRCNKVRRYCRGIVARASLSLYEWLSYTTLDYRTEGRITSWLLYWYYTTAPEDEFDIDLVPHL